MFLKLVLILVLRKIRAVFSAYKFYLSFGYIPPDWCIVNDIKNIKIGNGFTMGHGCKLFCQDSDSKIIIGNRVSFNHDVSINADGNGTIVLGDNTIIGPNTVLRASNHKYELLDTPVRDQGHAPGNIIIGQNVWLGANVVILPDVTIGDNVIVGAGSVVTKDIEDDLIVAGVPAIKINKRN